SPPTSTASEPSGSGGTADVGIDYPDGCGVHLRRGTLSIHRSPTPWHRRDNGLAMANSSQGASEASRYMEVERKFDVDDSTVSPSFDGLAAVARVERAPSHELDAVYYDTPGRDLTRHR